MIPFVIERTASGERSCDIYSRLLKDRIVFLQGEIDSQVAASVIAQMLFLQLENKASDINLYVMSPGGSMNAGLAIYDTMQHVSNEIATFCVGEACSMAALLLAAGKKGKRYALPSARIMLHQPWGGTQGDATSIEIQAQEMARLKAMLNQRLAKHTGKDARQLDKDLDRDFYMSAEEAQKYGLVDKVLSRA